MDMQCRFLDPNLTTYHSKTLQMCIPTSLLCSIQAHPTVLQDEGAQYLPFNKSTHDTINHVGKHIGIGPFFSSGHRGGNQKMGADCRPIMYQYLTPPLGALGVRGVSSIVGEGALSKQVLEGRSISARARQSNLGFLMFGVNLVLKQLFCIINNLLRFHLANG